MRTACTLFHYNNFPAFLYEFNPVTLLLSTMKRTETKKQGILLNHIKNVVKQKQLKLRNLGFT